jgi:hypothetical protein
MKVGGCATIAARSVDHSPGWRVQALRRVHSTSGGRLLSFGGRSPALDTPAPSFSSVRLLLPQRAKFRCRHSLHHELVERAAREFRNRCPRTLAQRSHCLPAGGSTRSVTRRMPGTMYPPLRLGTPTPTDSHGSTAPANEFRWPRVLGLHGAVTAGAIVAYISHRPEGINSRISRTADCGRECRALLRFARE